MMNGYKSSRYNLKLEMTMKRELMILMAGAAIAMSSCSEQKENITPTPGKDVSFSANLSGEKTRTVYGPESEDAKAMKVYWVEGDKIKVFGTNCVEGRKLSEYSVNTNGAKDHNYAESLDKTGDTGVQWGAEATSDFYAVYPSSNNGKDFTINENNDGSVTISASIRKDQKNIFSLSNNNKWVSYPYGTDDDVLSMPDAIMYACTKGVNNGETVDLQFKPFSTVLKFNIGGYTTNLTDPTLHISEVTITAPEGVMISGDFSFNIAQDGTTTVVPSANASNVINVYPTQKGGAYAPVKSGQDMEFSVFVMPQDGISLNENWTLKIYTDGGNFIKTLKPANAESADLVAGQIHKVNIKGTRITETPEFDPSKWITQIPRNVYLSELSVPGAWYCTNSEYQATTDLSTLYTAGVRAFNIDCRLTYEDVESFLGVATGGKGNLRLVCAGSEDAATLASDYNPGKEVIEVLKDLATLLPTDVSTTPVENMEFIEVVLTIAEKPLTRSSSDNKFGTIDPAKVIPAISKMLADNATALKLYTSPISSTTTVRDVLGHMIVKVNANAEASKFITYSTTLNAMISEGSMMSEEKHQEGDAILGSFLTMQESDIYWGLNKTDIKYYYHQAQRTTDNTTTVSGVPQFSDRESAISEIIKKSTEIYQTNRNRGWFQLGIGGYKRNSTGAFSDKANQLAVATELNPYVLDLIQKKLNGDEQLSPSPVGIVLMNYCTGSDKQGNGQALVDAILQMNGKFYLNRDPNAPEWPKGAGGTESGDTPTPVQSAKEGYSSGFNVDTENWNAF